MTSPSLRPTAAELSPITTWLKGGAQRSMTATLTDAGDRIGVALVSDFKVVGIGEGDTVDEAEAAALNDCMVRQHRFTEGKTCPKT